MAAGALRFVGAGMNAIPLRSPDGTVYTWACGVCHHVRANSERMLRNGPDDVKDLAEDHHASAEDCCKCRRCESVISAYRFPSLHCSACAPIIDAEMEAISQEQAKQDAESLAVLENTLRLSPDRDSALALRDLMSDISEEYYCAGWLSGLEDELWRMLLGGDRGFGMSEVTAEEVGRLRTLHERCGGWWFYDKQHGEMFITTAEWTKRAPSLPTARGAA